MRIPGTSGRPLPAAAGALGLALSLSRTAKTPEEQAQVAENLRQAFRTPDCRPRHLLGVMIVALGDADTVSVGDYHLPSRVRVGPGRRAPAPTPACSSC